MKRILGKVKKEIAIKNNIEEYADKKTFHYIMDNLEYIIENPDEVFYVKRKKKKQ